MLDTEIEYKRGILFVRLMGEVNNNTIKKLNADLEKIIIKAGIKYMVLNMEKTEFVDYEYLDKSIKTYKTDLGVDGKLLVCGYNKSINIGKNFESLYKTSNELNALNFINI